MVSPVGVIPRYSGKVPADMGTPQWITHGREGFTKDMNGRRYRKRRESFLNITLCAYISLMWGHQFNITVSINTNRGRQDTMMM